MLLSKYFWRHAFFFFFLIGYSFSEVLETYKINFLNVLFTRINGPINDPLEESSHWVWEPGRDRDEVKKAAQPTGALLRLATSDSSRELGLEWTLTWGSGDQVPISWRVMCPLGAHLDVKELCQLLSLPLVAQWSVVIDLIFYITIMSACIVSFKPDRKAWFFLSLLLKEILLDYLERFSLQHQWVVVGIMNI